MSHRGRQSPSRLDRVVQLTDQNSLKRLQTLQHGEAKLDTALTRAFEMVALTRKLREKVENTEKRFDFAFETQMPKIDSNLEASSKIVTELETQLPLKGEAVDGMLELYKSGRRRARILEEELNWLTMSYIWQIFQTAFLLRRPPRSDQWITNVRLFAYFSVALVAMIVAFLLGVFSSSRD